MNVLPVEMRDRIFETFDIKDYADYLAAFYDPHLEYASERFEHGLLERSAVELDSLNIQFWRDRERTKRLLSGVQTLVRLRFGLSLEEHESKISKDAVQALQENFKTLSSLSNNHLWRPAILAALAGRVSWSILLHQLSDNFVLDNLEVVLCTIAATGDFPLLDHTIKSYHLPRTTRLMHKLLPAIVFTGSTRFFDAVYASFPHVMYASVPSQSNTLFVAIKYSLLLKRYKLFRHLWKERLPPCSLMTHQGFFDKAFYAVCSHGELDIWREIFEAYPTLHQRPKVLTCLGHASECGNMPIIKYLLWDCANQCPRSDFRLDPKSFLDLIVKAAKSNQAEALRFFLFDLDECPAQALRPVLQHMAGNALVSGHVEVFELIFGLDRHGAHFVSDFDFGRINDEILTGLAHHGRLDVITYLVERAKGSRNPLDPRWQGLDLDRVTNEVLHEACANGHPNVVQFLLQKDDKNGQYLYPLIDPAAGNNACLINACAQGHLEVVKVLLREDEHGHRVHPTVQLGVPDNKPLLTAISSGSLLILEFLLHRVRKEDGAMHYTVLGAADCIQDPALIHAAIHRRQKRVLKFLLHLDSHGYPSHPELRLPRESLRCMVLHGWIDLLEASLKHHVDDRPAGIRLALRLALERRNLLAIHVLVNALHGSLPALEMPDGLDQLIDTIVTQRHIPRELVPRYLCPFASRLPWESKLGKRWLKSLIGL